MTKIVHIGYHKTGTTFLQDVLFRNHPEVSFIDRKKTQKLFLRIGSLSFNPEEVKKEINHLSDNIKEDKKAIVFSDEELSGNIHTGGNGGYLSKEIADRIYSVMPDAQIVISVRNQVDMIDSVYKQYVKKGGTLSLNKYLFNNGGANHRFPQFHFAHFEYDKLINYYIELFGRDKVHVLLYEDAKRDKDYYNKMLEQMGLSRMDNLSNFVSETKNPSYSKFSIGVARFFNHFYGEDPLNKRCIVHIPYLYKFIKKILYKVELTNMFDSSKAILDQDSQNYIKEYYKASNQELMEIMGKDLSNYNYPIYEQTSFSHQMEGTM